jgi:hypothetical protein
MRAGRAQVRALLVLRWRMVRARHIRWGLVGLGLVAVALVVLGVVSGATSPLGTVTTADVTASELLDAVPTDRTGEIAALLPSAMLAFGLLCVVAPLTAGGGYELLPESSLVAFPVRVATLVRLSLALSPLNIAWYLQVLVLSAATAYAVRGPGGPGLPLTVLLAFLAACTAVGQAAGWVLVGIRRTRRGRLATWAIFALLLAGACWVVLSDRAAELLESAPTNVVVNAQIRSAALDPAGWAPTVIGLVLATGLGYVAAVRTAAWALRRPGDLGIDGPSARPIRRRGPAPDEYHALLRMDRASVWRSPPLRRGLLVLGLLPVAAAVVASLPWSSIALLPPLVSSGAALLFGVNALALDGSGATWVATLPHDPMLVLRSKARVVLEVVAGSVVLVVVGAAARASGTPDLVDLLCVSGAAVSCLAIVVATCLHLSVTRPHRAELSTARDTPAPPGAMAVYSARLASVTTLVGVVFSLATFGRSVVVPIAVTVVVVLWAGWSWSRTRRRWAQDQVRARVVATVASG